MYKKYIIELDQQAITSIAQMLHVCLKQNPDDHVARYTLSELMLQANGVFSDPKKHRVYSSLEAPEEAVSINDVYYVPLYARKEQQKDKET